MNDSDTKFFANGEGIESIVPYFDNGDILTPEASIHIVKDNEKEQGKNSKNKLEEVQFQWRRSIAPNIREECNLVGEVCHQLKESASPLEVYEKVVNLDVLIELLVTQSNLYSQQNGRHFITDPEEMKTFLGTNYAMAVKQLPNISMSLDCDHVIGNNGIQNIFTRGRYQEMLQNFHFEDYSKQDQTNKGYKICPINDHLNKSFQESY